MSNIHDEIMEAYNEFYNENGYPPNELRVPGRMRDEFTALIQKSCAYWCNDPLGEIKHWWYADMRVFNEIFTFGVGWSEETELIKKKRVA